MSNEIFLIQNPTYTLGNYTILRMKLIMQFEDRTYKYTTYTVGTSLTLD